MSTISIRDLQRNTSGVIADVANSKRTALVTRHGEPIAPSFAQDMVAADQAHADGQTRSAADVFVELDAQDIGR